MTEADDDFITLLNDLDAPEQLWRTFETSVQEHKGEDGLYELMANFSSLTAHDRGVVDDVLATLCGETMSTLVSAALINESETEDEFEE